MSCSGNGRASPGTVWLPGAAGAAGHRPVKLDSDSCLMPVPPRAMAVFGLSARSMRYSTGTAMNTSRTLVPARDTMGGHGRLRFEMFRHSFAGQP
jgi:hypothetical protein